MDSTWSLLVRGQDITGWKSLHVTKTLESLAHSFGFTFADDALARTEDVVVAGDACEVRHDAARVIVGWVDDDDAAYDARMDATSVSGRSVTSDLVDCSALRRVDSAGAWHDRTLTQIATELCSPFGRRVVTHVDVGGPFTKFSIQDGETVFEALDRLARMRGVLVLTDGEGRVVFARAGSVRTSTVIERGKNVIAGKRHRSAKELYSEYTIKAQVAGDDSFFGEEAASIKRSVQDTRVKRYRPLVIHAEEQTTGKQLEDRAIWERNVRAGRAARLSYRVEGWEHADGLWAPNLMVPVVDPRFHLEQELLVVSASQRFDEQAGETTELELTLREAFDVLRLPPEKPKKDGFFG